MFKATDRVDSLCRRPNIIVALEISSASLMILIAWSDIDTRRRRVNNDESGRKSSHSRFTHHPAFSLFWEKRRDSLCQRGIDPNVGLPRSYLLSYLIKTGDLLSSTLHSPSCSPPTTSPTHVARSCYR